MISGIRYLPTALGAALLLILTAGVVARADAPSITLASTTSTDNSGLLSAILPQFERESGIEVHVVVVGTGRALQLARNGDVDVVLVHDRESEERLVAEGYGEERFDVMYNDFVIVGPQSDPVGIAESKQAAPALAKIAAVGAIFVSRGDDSGTHKAERRLWRESGFDPTEASGTWYRETGSGMGATLNTAVALDGYALADRGTWLSFRNRGSLEILIEGDELLFNPYGVILVDPKRHPHVKAREGRQFIDWLLSPEGQAAISTVRVEGEALFHPSAKTPHRSAETPHRSAETP